MSACPAIVRAVTTSTDLARTHALELESDLDGYPEERVDILLEAAGEWERAGEFGRARVLLAEVLDVGGEDADWARYSLACMCFQEGAEEDARAHLRVLEQRDDVAAVAPAELVAELLEGRGEYEAALVWFDRALGPDAGRLAVEIPQRDTPSLNDIPLYGRQRCRVALGLPPDALDRAADIVEQNRETFFARLERAARGQSATVPRSTRVEMLVWQRAEREAATERWPSVFVRIDNREEVERELRRQSADHNLATVTLIVGTADGLGRYLDRTGTDVSEESTRLAYAEEARVRGETSTWPPGRNQPCWCGSMRKYKKCCGGVGVVVTG